MSKKKKKVVVEIDDLDSRPLNGYIPSPPDDRDFTFAKVCSVETESADAEELPEEYITEGNIPVLNQGANSDCVAHAIATATAYGQYKAEKKYNDMSRGYIYGNRRLTDYQGEGMIVRQALKNYNHDGDCLNADFPYRGSYPEMQAKIAEKPEEYAKTASEYKLINYFRLYNEKEIKKAIMRQGSVVVGLTVFSGFGTHIRIPGKDDKKRGGHAMCCIGWNKDGWIIQNSWGSWWGDKGKCYLPYEYPVNEWWGLTTCKITPEPKKDSFWKRFVGFFKGLFNLLKTFFHK